MRIVTYASPAGPDRVGVVRAGAVHALEGSDTVVELLDRGELETRAQDALDAAREVHALEDVSLRAPLAPPAIRDCSAFHQHLRNCSGDPESVLDERHRHFPVFYFSNPAAVRGPDDQVPQAPGTSMFDFELEVGAVIGRAGHNIAPEDAEGHILGYTILVDWSARDLQLHERPLGLGPAKGKDTATTLGPAIVTAEELAPHRHRRGYALDMTAYLNGEQVTAGRWDDIDWTFADLVAYVSRGTTLRPGDVIGSGTVPGGCLLEHHRLGTPRFNRWLQPGDTVEVHVQHLGELTLTVAPPDPVHPLSSGY